MCGRIIGYQSGSTDGFFEYYPVCSQLTPHMWTVFTHVQSPRQHIWTFAGALDETRSNTQVCPCTRPDMAYTGFIPPFIGQDSFCATASRQLRQFIFYPDDLLWDGQGCGSTSTCCEFNNPPWFCTTFLTNH